MRRCLLSFLVIVVLVVSAAFSGTTGKIAGKVVDKETGEPLVGVNVIVEGTTLGAATDENGNFVILLVPPGVYSVRAMMIGYTDVTVKDVRVEIDLTTFVNFELEKEVIKGQVVEVVAKRKLIRKDLAASQKSVTSDEIEALPVTSVGGVLGLRAGITSGLSIRGSGSDQALFMVDGIVLRDERDNTPMVSLPLSAVREISVQTGGFGAEYSNVRSGIINVVTRDGDPDKYTGTFSFKYSPPDPKHFGISPYDPNSFWLRPRLDPEVCWTGTENGAWDMYTQRQYDRFEGWIAVSEATLQDDDPTNDLTPSAAKRIYEWEKRKKGYITKADMNLDFGFGGPVPVIGKKLGNMRFFLSHRYNQNMYLIKLSRDGVYDETWMLKLTSELTPSLKLSIIGLYNELYATTYSRTGGTSYISSSWTIADAIDRAGHTITWRIYTNDYWCPTSRYSNTLSAKLVKVVDPGTYWEMLVRRISRRYHTAPGPRRDTTRKYEIFPGYFVDEAPFGFEPEPVFGIDGMGMGGAISTSRDFSEFESWNLKFDYINQVNFRNQIKTGFEFVFDNFKLDFGMVNKFLPEGNTWTTIKRKPYRGNFYLQDKMEYEGFISTLGIVVDYINSNGKWYDVDDYSRAFFSSQFVPELEDSFLTKKIPTKFYVSPRLGISHPITVNSKLYFNYGHYRQIPSSQIFYRMQRTPTGQLEYIGDPFIPYARNIAYELGYDQSFLNSYLLHVTAYYKDIDHEQIWVRYISTDGKVNYRKLTANAYEDIRGIEIELSKLYGKYVTGNVNFEYRVGTSGYFGVLYHYENPADQREYERQNPYQTKPRPIPRVKSNITFHVPSDFGPEIFGSKIFGGWNFTFLTWWTGGYWFTWNPKNLPRVQYNIRRTDYFNVDLKIAKTFRIKNASIKFFADITNLFNIKYFSFSSFYDSHDYYYYMYSLHLPEKYYKKLGYDGIPGNDKPGVYRKAGVKFQPMEYIGSIGPDVKGMEGVIYYNGEDRDYYIYENDEWKEADDKWVKEVLDNRAYIDMPNQSYFTFLNPRDVFVGMTISFDIK